MRRRAILASMSALLVGGAGCIGPTSTNGSQPNMNSPTTNSPNRSDTSRRPFADEPCPSFAAIADRTICYHTVDRDPDVYVEPSDASFVDSTTDDAIQTLVFTLHNRSDQPFGLNPYDWAINQQIDDGWKHIAPDAVPEPYATVPPGEAFRWSLDLLSSPTSGDTDPTDNGGDDPDDPVRHTPARVSQTTTEQPETHTSDITATLESGTYAFQISGFLGRDVDRKRIECIALFQIEA